MAVARGVDSPASEGRVPVAPRMRRRAYRCGMKVLFVTSEFADFANVGGLGGTSTTLPRSIRRRGIDVRVLLPAYPGAIATSVRRQAIGLAAAILFHDDDACDGALTPCCLTAPLRDRRGGDIGNRHCVKVQVPSGRTFDHGA